MNRRRVLLVSVSHGPPVVLSDHYPICTNSIYVCIDNTKRFDGHRRQVRANANLRTARGSRIAPTYVSTIHPTGVRAGTEYERKQNSKKRNAVVYYFRRRRVGPRNFPRTAAKSVQNAKYPKTITDATDVCRARCSAGRWRGAYGK